MYLMLRGEIWWVAFTTSLGGEILKTRPAIIISNDAANRHANRVQVIPITSNTDKIYPCDALVNVDGRPGRAMADQLMTASKNRLTSQIGRLSNAELRAVESAVRIQLALAL
jgi:mRNA interferase MazF